MADRITDAETRLELVMRRLARRARVDLEGSVISAQSYEAAVSSSGGTSTTEASGLAQAQDLVWAGEHQLIARKLEHAASMLEDAEAKMTPSQPGGPCSTMARDPATGAIVYCTGEATHRGRCEQCDRDWRTRKPLGLPMDTLKARNDRRPRWCDCWCCQDGAGKTTCCDRAAPGRTVSERCKKRMQRTSAVS